MNNSFIIIPNDLLQNSNLSYGAILLLGIIYSSSKKLGYAYANNNYYAKKLSCSTRNVTKLIKELLCNNFIEIENSKSYKRKIHVRYKFPSSKKNISL